MKKDLVEEVTSHIKSTLQDDVRKEIREIEDQKQRALNLIIFNLPESRSGNSDDRKEFDKHSFKSLCELIGVNEPDIKVSFRLGNQREGSNRPLKIVMNNKKERKQILDNASKMKLVPKHNKFAKCIIAKDLTVEQRKANKKRRADKKKTVMKPQTDEVPEDHENVYNEQTVIINPSQFSTIATIENVNLRGNNTGDQSLSLARFLPGAQEDSAQLPRQDESLNQTINLLSSNISNIPGHEDGEDTVIGGITTEADAEMDTAEVADQSNK